MKKILLTVLLALSMTTSLGVYAVDSGVSVGESTGTTPTVSGDVNGDGVVNILDTLALKNHLVEGNSIEGYTYDTNGDGTSNRVDIIQSKRATFGLDNFSYYDDGIYDEYEPFNYAELNSDSVSTYSISISIKHQYSQLHKVWSAEDFGLDSSQVVDIRDLTDYQFNTAEDEELYLNTTHYVQVLNVYLTNPSVESMSNVIKRLEDEISRGNNVQIKKIGVSVISEPVDL
jgi:hypothetical protein